MLWYYARGNDQVGPFNEDDFRALIANGTISSGTLVWREGMAQWQPYGEVAAPQAAPAAAPQTPANLAPGTRLCVECGQPFPENDMVAYGDSWVCARCKPVFFQRIREGAPLPMTMAYGGFWIRFCAKFVDNILLAFVNGFIGAIIGGAFGATYSQSGAGAPELMTVSYLGSWFISIALTVAYQTFLVGKFGQTLGKMACGLKVVRPDGGSVSYMRAFGRAWAEMLSGLILAIGYIMAAFDSEKRTLHDRICDTRVIRTKQ